MCCWWDFSIAIRQWRFGSDEIVQRDDASVYVLLCDRKTNTSLCVSQRGLDFPFSAGCVSPLQELMCILSSHWDHLSTTIRNAFLHHKQCVTWTVHYAVWLRCTGSPRYGFLCMWHTGYTERQHGLICVFRLSCTRWALRGRKWCDACGAIQQ